MYKPYNDIHNIIPTILTFSAASIGFRSRLKREEETKATNKSSKPCHFTFPTLMPSRLETLQTPPFCGLWHRGAGGHKEIDTPQVVIFASLNIQENCHSHSIQSQKEGKKTTLLEVITEQIEFSHDSSQDWRTLWALHFPHPAVAVAAAAVDCHLSSIRIIFILGNACCRCASTTGLLGSCQKDRVAVHSCPAEDSHPQNQTFKHQVRTYDSGHFRSWPLSHMGYRSMVHQQAVSTCIAVFMDQLPWKPRINTMVMSPTLQGNGCWSPW